jgi:hypothetical protein
METTQTVIFAIFTVVLEESGSSLLFSLFSDCFVGESVRNDSSSCVKDCRNVGTDLVCFLSKNSELLDSSKTVCSENSENGWVVSITLSQTHSQ